jgi:hypothetical protein
MFAHRPAAARVLPHLVRVARGRRPRTAVTQMGVSLGTATALRRAIPTRRGVRESEAVMPDEAHRPVVHAFTVHELEVLHERLRVAEAACEWFYRDHDQSCSCDGCLLLHRWREVRDATPRSCR